MAAKLSSVEASSSTASVMSGRADATLMVCTPVPEMPKLMRSALLPLAVLLAAVMASRRLIKPSAPLLAIKVLRLVVSPSLVLEVVSTVMVAWVLDTAAMLRENSEVSVKVV